MKTLKNLILYHIYLFTIILSSQNQNGKIQYRVYNIQSEKTQKNFDKNKSVKFNDLVKNIKSKSKQLKLIVNFNGTKSFFTSKDPLFSNLKEERIYNLTKISNKITGDYYYQHDENLLIIDKEFSGERFLVESKTKLIDWKLINETQKIGQYTCYKAEKYFHYINKDGEKKKRKKVAWYTLEIPIPFGPKDFVGLPGLVIQAREGNNLIYEVRRIELNPKKEIIIKKPTKGKSVTQKEYNKILEESSSNLRLMLKRKN